MNATRLGFLKQGFGGGLIEIKMTLTYWPDLFQALFFSGISILVLFLMRGHHVPGTSFSLGSLTLPGVIGMNLAVGGITGVTALLAVDREDGTLLRAKATPGGMTGYVLGKITLTSGTALIGVVLTLILGLIAFPGLAVTVTGLLTLIWVVLLGLLATIPLGITLGSTISDPRFITLIVLPFSGLTAISGIFYPITHLPGWLQGIGQVFPIYWLGLGVRAALLPDALKSVELDGSWRLGWVLLALAGWAAVGLLVAPPVLRRMARRESGSRVAARRERAMLRAT
ncbi:MAG TPA: ABC transporter permease [Trebonia sp.]|nr:ABC transporter permease [Trebonia sp.]